MKLKVGDVVYRIYTRTLKSRIVINRVTNTLAIGHCEDNREHRFKIDVSSTGMVFPTGDTSKWSTAIFSVATPKLDAEYLKMLAIRQIDETDFSVLPLEKLKGILRILNTGDN